MAEYAPNAIEGLYHLIKLKIPSAILSGILGDAAHTYGYHRARNVLPSNDYSVTLRLDRAGNGWAASALDVKLTNALMQSVTQRLLIAAKNHDPRLRAVREFAGTTNGRVTHSYDLATGHEGLGEWDDSHLWHVHLSFYRAYADDAKALAPIAAVIAGTPASHNPPGPPAHTVPHWPLPAGHYFGLISGPVQSHGGFNLAERVYVKRIQQRLQALGYAPRTPGWADGIYQQPTVTAVSNWQHAKWAKSTSRYGEVWSDDWKRLFS